MKKSSRIKKYILLTGVLFLFPLSLILFFGVFTKHSFNTLPYVGTHTVAPNGTDTVYYRLPDFKFENHDGDNITLKDLEGKVWLAAFYGTSSPHIKKITKRLLWPNFRYRAKSDIVIVSFSLDPAHDTPAVLHAYVKQMTRYNDHPGKWQFLRGDSLEMINFIRDGFHIDDPTNTAYMYLVDTQGHLRGKYNGNLEEEIRDAIEDIALLKKEMDIREYEERKNSSAPVPGAINAH